MAQWTIGGSGPGNFLIPHPNAGIFMEIPGKTFHNGIYLTLRGLDLSK
jgi:hypothetical protein